MQQVKEHLRYVSIPRCKGSIHVLDQIGRRNDSDGTAGDFAGAAAGVDIHLTVWTGIWNLNGANLQC